MAKQVGKSKRVKEFYVANLTDGMDVSTNAMDFSEKAAQVIENMEFDSGGAKLRTRRGLGRPLYSFDSDIFYIWHDYGLGSYIVVLKNKKVYAYEFGRLPVYIGDINGDVEKRPQIIRFTNETGTKLLIASGGPLQYYEYKGSSINTDDKMPQCTTVMERFSRVLVSNISSNDIKYSGIANPLNWTENSNDASASKDLEVGDVSGVGGIYPLSSEIILFKVDGRIYRIANEPEDWNVTMVGEDSDFISRDAITNIGEDVIYFSNRGLISLKAAETYGNFSVKEVGEKMNPEMKENIGNPWIFKSPRTHQLFINPNDGNTIYVYHYQLNAFTKWVFPSKIHSISEGASETLVGCGNELFSLSFENQTDVVGNNESLIHQKIVSRRLLDLNIMTLYRNYIKVESQEAGSATLTVNDVSWKWKWTRKKQREEFKTQIRSDDMTFTFETDSTIIWWFWEAIVVQQYANMVSTDSSSSSSGGKSKWLQGTFDGSVSDSDGSPYG